MSVTPLPMRSSFLATVVFAGLVLASLPAVAKLPSESGGAGAGVRLALGTHDILLKPHGWLQFDDACVIDRSFSESLFQAKQGTGRIIVREFRGLGGNPYRRALPTMLGLDCVPYSVGYD